MEKKNPHGRKIRKSRILLAPQEQIKGRWCR